MAGLALTRRLRAVVRGSLRLLGGLALIALALTSGASAAGCPATDATGPATAIVDAAVARDAGGSAALVDAGGSRDADPAAGAAFVDAAGSRDAGSATAIVDTAVGRDAGPAAGEGGTVDGRARTAGDVAAAPADDGGPASGRDRAPAGGAIDARAETPVDARSNPARATTAGANSRADAGSGLVIAASFTVHVGLIAADAPSCPGCAVHSGQHIARPRPRAPPTI